MGGKVILKNLDFPEGPAFDSKGNLWFVELHGGNVARLGVDGVLARFRIDGGAPNGIAVDSSDKIWFCDAANDNVSILDPDTGEVSVFCDNVCGETLAHPNDLAFDGAGNISSERPNLPARGVRIEFSPTGVSADTVVQKLCIEAREEGRACSVVSSDGTIQAVVMGKGVTRISSRMLVDEIKQIDNDVHEAEEAPQVKMTLGSRLSPDALAKLKALRGR